MQGSMKWRPSSRIFTRSSPRTSGLDRYRWYRPTFGRQLRTTQGGDDRWAGDLGLQPGGRHYTAAGIWTRLTAMDFMRFGTAMKSMAVCTISAREFLPWH
ncbi:hypothetical protein NDU88_005487 [Pleurodeles waltl]|uniref:Uncharacterized protein n=1 Tax=Pleurodeles waltl TaxID=8319 RepID=A0AAV7NRM5_PLEWA|nr:hypothetical protein NDU88_005487 [Pleurodeles waltl]